jgi:hypothetical protein
VTWTRDYERAFQSFKEDIINSFTFVHPDYAWFLYVDASDLAVGRVLIQRTTEGVQQVVQDGRLLWELERECGIGWIILSERCTMLGWGMKASEGLGYF